MSTIDKIKSFSNQHPIIYNLILILLALMALIYATLIFLDFFTEHGKFKIVPNIKQMPLNEAIQVIKSEGFKYEITDSIYNDTFKPGTVVEQSPKEGARVKSNRTIYIGINAISPLLITLPSLKDLSERQAQAKLVELGARSIKIETVSSPFKGLVIDVKVNGANAAPGTKFPSSSSITLIVGDGNEYNGEDSLNNDDGEIVEGLFDDDVVSIIE